MRVPPFQNLLFAFKATYTYYLGVLENKPEVSYHLTAKNFTQGVLKKVVF